MANPAESKAELIAQDVCTVLTQIRKSDGFWYDVDDESVTRESLTIDEIMNANMPFFQVLEAESSAETVVMPMKDEELFEIMIDGLVEEENPSSRSTARERCIRDVRKQIQVDTTRGGNALFTAVRKIERFDSSAAFPMHSAFRITLEIHYRFNWATP